MNTERARTGNASEVLRIHGRFGNAPRQDDTCRSGPDDRIHVFLQPFGVQGIDAMVAQDSRFERDECTAFPQLDLLGFLTPPFDPAQWRFTIIKACRFIAVESIAIDPCTR